ncbi:Gfo/Idh/MocA family protein [Flavimaricola marinus]|uniref:1,5-anhydro-D-fructose reductase n=1 Tax=Flavimaricola marinus TaxID=1819565 RepID=A0A238LGE5_9RHOB|nr:Gfo/Idh/MocA family oxidoreductase [Flavimaricola marinus]SMY08036.1 1,5-anhydro-D-fructose reductase [Flavimaricola marinus]
MLRTALVGFGWWGQHIARRLKDNDGFDLRLVVEPALAAHDAIREMGLTPVATYAEALTDEVEAVILTSPNDQHDSHVLQAVAAGKHVFCEKPLSLSADGARASVAACEAAGLVLGVGHERRFEPAILRLREMLAAGDLGTIMHSELAFSHDKLIHLDATSWRTSKAMAPAAGMTQMGIHLTDLLISFFGRVKSVAAVTADRSLGWETGDVVSVQLQFEEGMTATLQAILHTPHFLRTHVFGSDMWVEIRNATHPDTPGGAVTMECYRSIDDNEMINFEWTDSVTANLEAWAAAIAGRAPYPYTSFELVHNIEVLEAIVQSAETGQVVYP